MTTSTLRTLILVPILAMIPFASAMAEDSPTWDNQAYIGNKITFGKNRWKFSGELQVRLEDNLKSLDNWYLEFVSNYLASENFEVVPDLRFTRKPDKVEFRPGLGVLYKINTDNIQFINQVKWQLDVDDHGKIGNALREVVFLNHRFTDRVISTLVAGFIYRWWTHWNGIQYVRVGPGISYVLDEKLILNFSYFVGVEHNTEDWMWAGIPMIQLVVNLSQEYKYTPAYYFDF